MDKSKVYMCFSGGYLFDQQVQIICSTEEKAKEWIEVNRSNYAELHYSEVILDEVIE